MSSLWDGTSPPWVERSSALEAGVGGGIGGGGTGIGVGTGVDCGMGRLPLRSVRRGRVRRRLGDPE
ncbi:hypothetical protein ACFY5C_31380 [Streptomyces sp. NPDC012935]|uniref:hypothetical protein n=1 Tax=Streptomyces sp. NPDC012935 TaxID=3364857 RepID=UPI0036807AB7